MTNFLPFVLLAAVAPGVPLPHRDYTQAGPTLLVGEIDQGVIWSVGKNLPAKPTEAHKYNTISAYNCQLSDVKRDAFRIHSHSFYLNAENAYHYRVYSGCLWIHNLTDETEAQRIPIKDFPFAVMTVDSEPYRKRFGRTLNPFGWILPREASETPGGNFGGKEPSLQVWYHGVPVASEEMALFLLRKTNPDSPDLPKVTLFECFQGKGKLLRDDLTGEGWGVTWAEPEVLEAAFTEAFQVRIVGNDYYFITEAGRVFFAPKPAKGKQRKLEEIWGKDKPPIMGILTDNDKKEVYLFGKSKDSKDKAFFFPLSAKPQPKEFDAALLSAAKTVDEPMRTVIGMARAVQAAEKKSK